MQQDTFWVPDDLTVVHRPEITYLSSQRPMKFTNAVIRTKASRAQMPGLIDEVRAAHAHTTSRWMQYPSHAGTPLMEALGDAGYVSTDVHDGMTLSVEAFVPKPASSVVVRRVADRQGLLDCIDVCGRAFGQSFSLPEHQLLHELALCLGPTARSARFVAYDAATDEPLGSGGINRYPNQRFGLLWGGGTIPEARGRGVYGALLSARVDQCRTWGRRCSGSTPRRLRQPRSWLRRGSAEAGR